jgi:hypothetical protein
MSLPSRGPARVEPTSRRPSATPGPGCPCGAQFWLWRPRPAQAAQAMGISDARRLRPAQAAQAMGISDARRLRPAETRPICPERSTSSTSRACRHSPLGRSCKFCAWIWPSSTHARRRPGSIGPICPPGEQAARRWPDRSRLGADPGEDNSTDAEPYQARLNVLLPGSHSSAYYSRSTCALPSPPGRASTLRRAGGQTANGRTAGYALLTAPTPMGRLQPGDGDPHPFDCLGGFEELDRLQNWLAQSGGRGKFSRDDHRPSWSDSAQVCLQGSSGRFSAPHSSTARASGVRTNALAA